MYASRKHLLRRRFKELRTLTVVGTAFFLTFVTKTAVLLWACMTMDPGIVMPGYARKLLQEGEPVEASEEDEPRAVVARNNGHLPALKLGFEAGQEGLGDPDAHGDVEQKQVRRLHQMCPSGTMRTVARVNSGHRFN